MKSKDLLQGIVTLCYEEFVHAGSDVVLALTVCMH